MGRTYSFRDTQVAVKRTVHPVWRGIGFIILVLLTVGGFWLAGYLVELNWQTPFLPIHVPRNFEVVIHPALPRIPGKLAVQIGAMLLLDVVGYALMVVAFGIINPIRRGPTDAPPPRGGRRGRSMVR